MANGIPGKPPPQPKSINLESLVKEINLAIESECKI